MDRTQKIKGENQQMNFNKETGNGLKQEESRSPWTGSRSKGIQSRYELSRYELYKRAGNGLKERCKR
jgi:hypothetical protein